MNKFFDATFLRDMKKLESGWIDGNQPIWSCGRFCTISNVWSCSSLQVWMLLCEVEFDHYQYTQYNCYQYWYYIFVLVTIKVYQFIINSVVRLDTRFQTDIVISLPKRSISIKYWYWFEMNNYTSTGISLTILILNTT